jgi:hypothetical protein
MQRALSLEDTPTLAVPLRFLLTAPWFALAAALFLLWQGPDALVSRWSPATLALTHLITLGFLAMTMAGALLQLLPVVAGFEIPGIGPVARATWLGLGCGSLLLALALFSGQAPLFAAAALVLGLPLAAFLVALAAALARRASPGALPMICGVRLALPALGVTAALGLSLAASLAGGPALALVLLTDLHAAWGLLGWVAVLVAAVAFQVVPLFQATPTYPPRLAYGFPPAVVLLLLAASAAALRWPGWLWLPGAALALCMAGFAALTLYLIHRRKRPAPDVTTRYWRLSMGCLLACAALYLWPAEVAARPLLLGVLFIGGFAMSAVNGMLYKIVPFLLWYHLAQAGVERRAVPGVNAWIGERGAAWQFRAHAAAVGALAAAVFWPAWSRAAALVFALGAGGLALLLSAAALRYRRVLAASALERA